MDLASLEIKCLVPAGNSVGESAVWCQRTQSLYWVDIGNGAVWRWSEANGAESWPMLPDRPTSIGLTSDRRLILGLLHSVALWRPGGELEILAKLEPDHPGNRLNEARVGPDGAYWVGTMENNLDQDGRPVPIDGKKGRLYRVATDGSFTTVGSEAYAIPNGFGWAGDYFYAADTIDNALYRYVWNNGVMGSRKSFGALCPYGLPDGSCVDAEGYIWNARVADGRRLVRYSPEGWIEREIELPCRSPTSCTFGGPELDTLFITSARFGLDDAAIAANPLEGALFTCKPGVRGCPEPLFG